VREPWDACDAVSSARAVQARGMPAAAPPLSYASARRQAQRLPAQPCSVLYSSAVPGPGGAKAALQRVREALRPVLLRR
jgi:hypothetical protein